MKLSEKGYKALDLREGLKLKPYLDTEGIPTIARGNTYYLDGTPVTMKDPVLTLSQAEKLGNIVADDFAKFVDSKIKKQVTQDQFDACVSICYNIGKGGFSGSTLLRLINTDPTDIRIADAIAMWRKNIKVRGRRAAELKQFFSYDKAGTDIKKYIDKVIKSKLVLIFLLVMLQSCDIYKKSSKTKSDSDLTEQIETKTFRKGDTVHYEIPNVILKDTTVYTYNRQGTTLKTVYNQSGQIASIDCFSSAIEEFKKENRKLLESIKEKDSEKKEEVNTTVFFYMFGAVVLIMCFGFFLIFQYIKKLIPVK